MKSIPQFSDFTEEEIQTHLDRFVQLCMQEAQIRLNWIDFDNGFYDENEVAHQGNFDPVRYKNGIMNHGEGRKFGLAFPYVGMAQFLAYPIKPEHFLGEGRMKSTDFLQMINDAEKAKPGSHQIFRENLKEVYNMYVSNYDQIPALLKAVHPLLSLDEFVQQLE